MVKYNSKRGGVNPHRDSVRYNPCLFNLPEITLNLTSPEVKFNLTLGLDLPTEIDIPSQGLNQRQIRHTQGH